MHGLGFDSGCAACIIGNASNRCTVALRLSVCDANRVELSECTRVCVEHCTAVLRSSAF